MAYDYSPSYLSRHAETVDQIRQLWNGTIEELKKQVEGHEEVRALRYIVRNIISSLELNLPEDFKDAGRQLRTWVTREGDYWVLHVGRPTFKLPGGPGFRSKLGLQAAMSSASREQPEQDYGKIVNPNASDWHSFQMWVASKIPDHSVKVLRAEFGRPIEKLEAFAGIESLGWKASLLSPTTLKLERQG